MHVKLQLLSYFSSFHRRRRKQRISYNLDIGLHQVSEGKGGGFPLVRGLSKCIFNKVLTKILLLPCRQMFGFDGEYVFPYANQTGRKKYITDANLIYKSLLMYSPNSIFSFLLFEKSQFDIQFPNHSRSVSLSLE